MNRSAEQANHLGTAICLSHTLVIPHESRKKDTHSLNSNFQLVCENKVKLLYMNNDANNKDDDNGAITVVLWTSMFQKTKIIKSYLLSGPFDVEEHSIASFPVVPLYMFPSQPKERVHTYI